MWRGKARTNGARWVGRSRMCRFGFWVLLGLFAPVCDPRGPAFVFSSGARSCLGLWPLSGLTGAVAAFTACTNGCERTPAVAFHRSPVRGSPAAESALGVCVRSVGLATITGKQYQRWSFVEFATCPRRPFAFARRDGAHRSSPLTSLQRVEATDALPIRGGSSCEGAPGTGNLSEVLHRP